MSKKKERNPRLGCVGGQAVMEGVMMKSKTDIAIAVHITNARRMSASLPPTKDPGRIANASLEKASRQLSTDANRE